MDDAVTSTIGRTPLVPLRHVVPDGSAQVLVKLESGNPTGSYKDRMALAVVTGALDRGDVRPGDRIVEYTGGSTGMALAFICARLGLGFTAVSSDAFAEVKLRAMAAYGAEVLVERSDGTITPELIDRMRRRAMTLAAEPGVYYADQFGSVDVRRGYLPMGVEIAEQSDGRVDVLCAGVGTGGALMGAADGLRQQGIEPQVVPLEPAQSPLLSTGVGGPHVVEGIGVGFAPPFLDQDHRAAVRTVDQDEAVTMARRLASEEGLLCGTSTGLNVVAAVEIARELGPGGRVVTLGCDSGTKYLAGDLYASAH